VLELELSMTLTSVAGAGPEMGSMSEMAKFRQMAFCVVVFVA
jgi:hypothetical protein